MPDYTLTHLAVLEAEAIFVIREVAASFAKPVLLFSGGKDSIVLVHLSRKAFFPARLPFPLLHIDTGHNFPETIAFRDRLVADIKAQLIVKTVQESIDTGRVVEEQGVIPSRNALQTTTLLDALSEQQFTAALGGARRDEEKARAKERFFSHRNAFGQWDPKNQRPELWNLFNSNMSLGEHFRVFPLSNWTEMDVWQYIKLKNLALPELYFAHEREVFIHNGQLLALSEHVRDAANQQTETARIRFRTIGDMTCTGAVKSDAGTIDDIIDEVASARLTERGGRADDKRSETSMEDRKKEGYF